MSVHAFVIVALMALLIDRPIHGFCLVGSYGGCPCIFDFKCDSSACRGSRCCATEYKSNCHKCDSNGKCSECNSGYFLLNGMCFPKKSAGQSCNQDIMCHSANCDATKCCTTIGCATCDASGTCLTCKSSYYNPAGNCPDRLNDGSVCSSASMCKTGKCKARCCKTSIVPACITCNSVGLCTSCISSHYLSSGNCYAKKSDGASCAGNVQCINSDCHTRCCKTSAPTTCTTCSSVGDCEGCSTGYYLENKNCFPKKAPGTLCDVDVQCQSSNCESSRCCKPGFSAGCNACDANGDCATCASGYFKSSGDCEPQKADGQACSADNQCLRAHCHGRCCKLGIATQCVECDAASGSCAACTSTHFVYNGNCQLKKPPGDLCDAPDNCVSGDCEGSRCCTAGMSTACGACNASGSCTVCSAGYYLDNKNCTAEKLFGAACSADNQCQSGRCRSHCCYRSMTLLASCASCDSLGNCTLCEDGYFVTESGGCEAVRSAGTSCSADKQCASAKCKASSCCRTDVAIMCASCNSTGLCDVCQRGWYLEGVECLKSVTLSASITANETRTMSIVSTATTSSTRSETKTSSTTTTNSIAATQSASIALTPSATLTPTATVSNSSTTTQSVLVTASGSTPVTPSMEETTSATMGATSSVSVTRSIAPSSTVTLPATPSLTIPLPVFQADFVNGSAIDSLRVGGKRAVPQMLSVELTGERFDLTAIRRQAATAAAAHNVSGFPAAGENPQSHDRVPLYFLTNLSAVVDTVSSPCVAYIAATELYYNNDSAAEVWSTPFPAVSYLNESALVDVQSDTVAEIHFPPRPGFTIADDLPLTLWMSRGCLASRRPFTPINFTFIATQELSGVPEEILEASKAIGEAAVVIGGLGSPVVATQMSRSTLVLGLAECEPEDGDLDVSQSPFSIRLTDSSVGQYVSGAIMNHVVMGSFAIALAALAFTVSKVDKATFLRGCETARFPSLLAFSTMLFIEPTAMCCVMILIHGSAGVKVAGVFSLLLLVAMPIALFWYLRRRRGEFVFHPEWDEPRNLTLLFFFGRCKWTDKEGPHTSGFCQRHRLLFCDYVGKHWYFLCAEMVMSIICGSVDGIKLGYGQCKGVAIALLLVLLIYVLILLIVRPYNSLFLAVFAITLALLQLIGSMCMMIHMLFGSPGAFAAAEWISVVCMWLLSLRLVFDIAPKTYRLFKSFQRFVYGVKLQAGETGPVLGKFMRFEDLRDRVLVAMDDDTEENLDTVLRTEENIRAGDAVDSLLDEYEREYGQYDDDEDFFPEGYYEPPEECAADEGEGDEEMLLLDDNETEEEQEEEEDYGPVYYEGAAGDEVDDEADDDDDFAGLDVHTQDSVAIAVDGLATFNSGGTTALWKAVVESMDDRSAKTLGRSLQDRIARRFEQLSLEVQHMEQLAQEIDTDEGMLAAKKLSQLPRGNEMLAMLTKEEVDELTQLLDATNGLESSVLKTRLKTASAWVAERHGGTSDETLAGETVLAKSRSSAHLAASLVDGLDLDDDDDDLGSSNDVDRCSGDALASMPSESSSGQMAGSSTSGDSLDALLGV